MPRLTRRSTLLFAGLACLGLAHAGTAISAPAEPFLTKPVTLIVPFGAGGASDTLARTVSASAAGNLGQPMVVELMPGASGVIGTTHFVRNATPDGHTLIIVGTSASTTVPHSQQVAYDPIEDFEFIIGLIQNTEVLAVNADFPANNAQEFVDYVKANPGKVRLGHPGTGGEDWAVIKLMSREFGAEINDVPFDGGGAAAIAAAGGHIEGVLGSLASVTPFVESGKMKLLAVLTTEPAPNLPDVQTFAQIGFPDVVLNSRVGIAAPKGTPPELVAKLHDALKATMDDESFKGLAQRLNLSLHYLPSEEYKAALKAEFERMGTVFKQ